MAKAQAITKLALNSDFNFFYTFRPIYYFNRVFGLMPYTFTYTDTGTILGCKVRPFDMLWFIASIVLNITFLFITTKDSQYLSQDLKTASTILTSGDYFLEVFSIIFNIVLITMDMFLRSNLTKIFKKINRFDEEVSELWYSIIHLINVFKKYVA